MAKILGVKDYKNRLKVKRNMRWKRKGRHGLEIVVFIAIGYLVYLQLR